MENKDIKEMYELVKSNKFYDYDLKNEMFKKYCLINDRSQLRSKETEDEKNEWYEIKLFNRYVGGVNNANKAIHKLNKKIKNTEYEYLKKYLLFRYQVSKNNNHFDCDVSYPVYLFYKDYLKKVNDKKFNYKLSIDNKYRVPQYLDTYFSMQSIWGPLIENLYNSGALGKKVDKKNFYVWNDFEWQINNFDKITNHQELKKLLKALNEFAHYYHTIGNIAPCAPRINSPKGLASGCYDRLDLFLEKELNNGWLKWYFSDTTISTEKSSVYVNKLHLQKFLKPDLGEIVIPKDVYDKENIKKLTDYVNNMIAIIKDRSKELKKI